MLFSREIGIYPQQVVIAMLKNTQSPINIWKGAFSRISRKTLLIEMNDVVFNKMWAFSRSVSINANAV